MVSLSHETVRLRLKKHPQALAEAAVVHLPDERGVCGGHGGRAGPVRLSPTTPTGRWCASTRPPPSCWPRCELRCPPSQDDRGGRTTSIVAAAPAICSWPANPWLASATWPSPSSRTMQDFAHQMRLAGGRGLPRCPSRASGTGQSEHPPHGVPLRDPTQRSGDHHRLAVQHPRRQSQTPSFLPLPFQR